MSEDFQIQGVQQQSSTLPYALTGAAIGGGAGWAGAHYLTKPKYGSYDDILKEAKDSAEFSKKIDKAEGEDKKFLERMQEIASKETTAGAEYDKLLEEYKEAHKGEAVVEETPEFKKLVEELENKKKTAQEKAEADIRANNTEKVIKRNGKEVNIAEVTKEINKVISERESEKVQYIAKRNKAIEALNRNLARPRVITYKADGTAIVGAYQPQVKDFMELMDENKSVQNNFEELQRCVDDPKRKMKKGTKKVTFERYNPKTKKKSVVTDYPKTAEELESARTFQQKAFDRRLKAVMPKLDVVYQRNIYDKNGKLIGKKDITVDGTELRRSIATEAYEVALNNVENNINVRNQNAAIRELAKQYGIESAKVPSEADMIAELKKLGKKDKTAADLVRRIEAIQTTIADQTAEVARANGEVTRLEAEIAAENAKPTPDKAKLNTLRSQLTSEKSKLTAAKSRLSNAQSRSFTSEIDALFRTRESGNLQKLNTDLANQRIYRDILRSEELINTHNGRVGNVWQRIGSSIGEWLGVTPDHLNAAENRELKEIGDRLTQVKENLKAVYGDDAAKIEEEFNKLVTDAKKTTIAAADKKITKLQADVKAIQDTLNERTKARQNVAKINQQVERLIGEKGGRIDVTHGTIIKPDGTVFKPTASTVLTSSVQIPAADATLSQFDTQIASIRSHIPNATKLTDEEIIKLANERVQQELAEDIKSVEDARNKLQKGEAKTPEQLAADFVKEKGERKAYIENAVKESENSIKKECEQFFKRRFGFAEGAGWKIGAVAAGSAVVFGTLFNLLAPKDQA